MGDISQTPSTLWLISKALRSESPMHGRLQLGCDNFDFRGTEFHSDFWDINYRAVATGWISGVRVLEQPKQQVIQSVGCVVRDFSPERAQEAAHLDASGDYLEAEVRYSSCISYLEQEADEQQGFDSDLANARSWVYLALANLYRFSTDTNFVDHWKATECLLSLLYITIASKSSSERLREIRFAICLTVLEWADALLVDPDREKVLLAVFDEAREVIEAWERLYGIDVGYYLADKLVRGYEKLAMKTNLAHDAQQIMLSRVEHWSEKRMLCNIHGMQIGDYYFDTLIPTMSSSPEFQCLPEDLQTGMKTILNKMEVSSKKAWIATDAGHFLEAGRQYEACVVSARFSVKAAIKALPMFKPMHTLLGDLLRTLLWIHNLIGEFYWFYNMDLEKAANNFEACLLVFEWFKVSGNAHLEEVNHICCDIRKKLIEIMYERAHDLKVGVKTREELLALADSNVRGALSALLERDCSDEMVGIFACENLRERYWHMGRLGYALKWTEELIKLIPKTDPYRNNLLLEISDLVEQMGDRKRAYEILPEKKKKRIPKKVSLPETTSRDLWSYIAMENLSMRKHQLEIDNLISESGWPNMTPPMDDEEEILEQAWTEKILENSARLDEGKELGHVEFQSAMMNCFDALLKAMELVSQTKYAEAIELFQNCMGLISKFRNIPLIELLLMQCLGQIATCCFNLSRESSPDSLPYFLQETIKYSSKALRIAQERNDYIIMATEISLIGRCYLNYTTIFDPPLCDEAHEYITQAVYLFCTVGRFLSTHLYFEKYPSPLWIAAQENDDLYLAASYYIQMSLYRQFLLYLDEAKSQSLPIAYLFDVKAPILWSQALIWAERGHSRLLACKLIERSMGANTLEQLKQFDLGHFEESLKSIQEGRDACGPDTVMIEYVKARGSGELFFVYVLGVGKQKYVDQMILLGKEEHFPDIEDLETLLPKLNNHMSQKVEKDENGKVTKSYELPEDEVYQILEDLYTMFIKPIEVVLSWKSTKNPLKLVICANKNLAGVPFAALRNPDTKEFLIQRYTVMCTPSLRILKECGKRYKDLQSRTLMPGEAALVLGDPAFEIGTTPLPSSGDEADNIATILGHDNVKLLKGRDALKDKVLNWVQAAAPAGQYQALMHLGTHGRGKADNVKFKEGALEFANPRIKTWPRQESHESQRIINAEEVVEEISCAGASTSTSQAEQEPAYEVGRGGPRRAKVSPLYLTAEEIMKDNEWSMLVAVLSACDTARGEVKAEGILNLARALLIAGVPCTVVSQWRVEDESTSNLMVGMYSSMVEAKGMDVASALRNSMVRMIKEGFRVHQWAPFVVVGLGTVTLPDQLLARLPHSSTQRPEYEGSTAHTLALN